MRDGTILRSDVNSPIHACDMSFNPGRPRQHGNSLVYRPACTYRQLTADNRSKSQTSRLSEVQCIPLTAVNNRPNSHGPKRTRRDNTFDPEFRLKQLPAELVIVMGRVEISCTQSTVMSTPRYFMSQRFTNAVVTCKIKLFQNYFGGLLQLMNLLQHVQCR